MAYGRARGPLWEELRPYMSPLQGPTPHTQAVVICWVANNLHPFHDIFFLQFKTLKCPPLQPLCPYCIISWPWWATAIWRRGGTLVNPQSGNTELGANFPSQFGASFVISPFWNIQKHVLTLTSGIKGWLTHTRPGVGLGYAENSRNNTHSQRGGSVSQACQRRPLKGRHVNIYGHVNEQSKGVEHTNIWVLGEQQSCESYNFAILMVEGGGQYVWGNINGVSVVYV